MHAHVWEGLGGHGGVAETSALFFVKTDRTWMASRFAWEGLGDMDKLFSWALAGAGDTISS